MNKIYKVIWSKVVQAWVVVSELGSSQSKGGSVRTLVRASNHSLLSPLSAVAFAVSMAFAGLAQAVVVSTTGYTNGSPNASIVIGSAVGNTGCWGGTGTASGVDYSAVSAVDGSGQLASVWGCANGNGQVAATLLGSGAKANGAWATAMGPYAEAGTRGSAFGVKANAGGNDAVALGSFANATASQTVAIGGSIGNAADATNRANATTASAVGAVAIGSNTVRGAQASGTDSIAIGGQSTASGGGTIAIGNLATGTVANTVAIGVSTNATGFDSVALGSGAQALAGGANIAIGRGAYTNGTSSPANPANGTNISIGSAAGVGQTTTANGNVAIGGNAGQNVSGRANLAMGFQAGSGVSGNANIAFGRSAGFGGTAAAPYAQSGSVAIGDSALSSSATGYSTAVGSYAQATGQQAIAIGGGSAANSIASGNNAVAIGTVGTQATSSNTVALGSSAQANAISAIAVGNSAHALGQGSVVMGSAAGQLNTQAYTIAIGNSAGTATTGTTNTENTAIGRSAGQNVSGNTNLALSSQAGQNVSGSNNFAAMLQAGQYVSGNNNIAIGQTAGRGSAATAMAASHTVALSTGAVASQDNAIAIGRTSQATNANAVAMGYTARALGANSIAMGNAALVNSSAGNAIAIGINALSTTYSGVAIGDNARATTSGLTSATAGSSTAIGRNAGANLGTAVGEGAWAASSSVSIGRNAASVPKDWSTSDMNTTNNNFGISNYPGAGNVVIGDNARAMVGGRGANLASVALGYGASIVATDETTITNQRLLGVGSATALGGNTLITGSTGATVVGANANSTGSNGSVSVGQYATAGTLARGILTPAEAGIAIGGARYNTNGAVVASTATRVTGEAAIAIGSALPTGTTYQITTATAANAIALGTGAQALAENTISIGTGNVVRGANSGALGDPSYISGSGTYTIGNDNGTSAQPIAANNSGAFGNNNAMIVGGSSGIRIVGNNNNVSSSNVMVLGNNVIVGTGLDGAVVLGNDSTVSKAVDTAKTDLNGLTYTYATAGAAPADGDVVSVGTAAKPRQIQNVANGQVSATSLDAINGSQLYAVADTLSGKLTHFYSVANTDSTAGNYNNDGATGANAMALGPNAKAVGAQSIAMGLNAQTSDGADSVAIGHESNASTGSVAMGRGTVANGQNAVAIGLGAQATSAESDNFGGVAIGGQSRATTPTGALYTATAIGYSSQATTDGALALGDTAKATANAGDVALGSNSATAAVVNTTEAGIGGLKYSGFAGTAATSTVSVGDTDKERTLTNVAAGRISQTSTDAINGSQLYATNLTLSNVATTAVSILGGDAKLATDGNITMTNIGDTGKTTVHDAIKAAKTEVTNGTNVTSVVKTEGANGQAVYTVNANGTTASAGSTAVTVSADPKDGTTNITNYKVDLSQETKDSIAKADSALQSWTAQVNGTTAKTIDKDNTTLNFVNGDNILITNDNGGIKVSTSMTPTFTSVNATTITAPTISTGNGGPSMTTTGIDAGSQKITNVTAGSADTDAVNYSQLKAVQDAAKTSSVVKGTNVASVTSTTTGVNTEYTVNADGTTVSGTGAVKVTAGDKNATTNVTDYALDLTDKTKEDIAKGVTASEDIASKGIAFAGDSGDNATRKLGETLNVKGGNTTEANLTDNNIGVVSNGADTLTVKLAKDINLGATGSLTINNNKLDKDGLEVVSGVTSVSVKPIKLGDPVSVVATDGSNTAVYGAKGLSFTETNGTPLANSPSISQTGINAGSQQITAVKSGVDGTTLADAAGDTLTNAANIGDVKNAITNLETQYQGDNTTVTVKRKPAEVLSITGGATDLTDNNIGTVGNADGSIAVKLAKNLTGLTDVATESLSVGDKVTITSAGIDAGGLPITNVADGVNDDDAVNMSQLNKVAGGWEIGNDITEDKIGNVAAGKRVDFVSGNEESTQVTVAQGADGNSVVTVEAAPGALRYSNTNTAAGGNVSTGDQFTATDSVTLVGKDGDTSGGVTINNVAPGTLSADSKQAVNGSQLFATNTNVTTNATNITNLQTEVGKGWNVQANATAAEKVAMGDTVKFIDGKNIEITQNGKEFTIATAAALVADSLTITNGPVINAEGINAGSQQITAVKSGVDGTTLADAAGDTLTNAANIGDVKNAITNLETQYQGDNTTVTVKRKPAEVLSITGGATDLTDNNIGTVGNADGSIAVKLAKNLTGLTDVATESLSVGDKVTITSAGIDAGGLPITNVADGVNDDDAVNMSQLNKVAGGWEIGNDITEDKIGNVAAGKRVDFVSGNEESTQVTVAQGADGNSVVTVEAAPGALRYSNTNTAAGGNVSTGDQFTATDSVTLVGKDGDTSGGVTINNVAPGTLSADSKQAVNGSQLFETNQNVAINTTNIATNAANIAKGINFGGTEGSNKYALGDTINVKGDSNITSTTIAGGTQLALANTVTIGNATTGKPVTINGEAGTVGGLTNTTFDAANITSGQAATEDQLKAVSEVASAGWNVQANDTTAANVAPNDTVTFKDGKNILVTQEGKTLTIATSDTPEFTSVKIGDATNNTTLTSTANGLDVGGDKITNVATGTADTDAVNVAQLNEVAGAAAKPLTFAGNSRVAADGTSDVERKLGETLKIYGATDGSLTALSTDAATAGSYSGKNIQTITDKTTGAVQIQLAENPEFTSVKIGDTTNNTTLTSTANGLDVGGDKITNLKSGLDGTTLGNASGAVLTNAVNVADLQSAVTGLTDGGFKVNADNADAKTHKLGNELAIVAGNATDTSSSNLATKVEQDADGKTTVTVSMKNAPTFTGTVTAPTFVTSGNNPVTIGDGKVTGLVAPTEDGDAANKKYVDDQVTNINTTVDAVALNTSGDSGAGNVNLKTQTLSVTGTADQIETTAADQGIKLKLSDKVTDSLAKADNAVQYDDPAVKDKVTLGGTDSTTPVQLTNVKAGDLSANSTDAVNGSQLFATNQNIETLQKGWNVTTSQSDGTASGSAVTAVKAEDTVTIDAGKNIVITQDGQKVSIATSATPEFSSVKIGDDTNNTTLTSTANGLDVGGDKITNVGSGTVAADSTDAVNGGDVYTAIQNTETQYQGDNTAVTVKRKPTDVLSVKGGAAADQLTDNNIGTVGAEDGSITVKLAKNLTGLEKVTVGDSELTTNGLTISNGTAGSAVSLTKDGLNNGGNQITNVKSGLGDTALGDASGAVLTNAVNVADLQSAVTGLTDSGFKVNADNADVKTHKLGNELAIVAGNATDTVTTNLATNVTQDADGKTTVTVSMKESPTFKDITATSVTADDGAGNVTKLTATGTTVTDGTNTSTYGADGLVIKDKDGKEVASLDSTPITVKDNDGNDITNINTALNQLNSVQQTADSFAVKYDKNADGTPNKDSVTLAGTEATATKDDTTGVITTIGGTSLNNVASAGDISDVANANKAVNAADLNNQVVNLTNKGLIFGANDGTDYTAKLGSTVAVKGADSNTDFSKFDAGQNIMTQIDNGLIRVALAKDLSGLDSVTVGKDANGNTTVLNGGGTTVTNDDGRTASYGVDGMSVKGADGTSLASVGKDGVSTTGTVKVVDDSGNTVAQLDNTQMNVGGNSVTSVNEAINQLDKAAAAAKTTVTAGDNIVVTPTTNSDGSMTYNVATAKDLKVDSVKAGDTTINNDGLTIAGGPSVTKAGIDAAGTKITNVASGDISATSTDAVNGGDVHNAIKNATSDLVDSGLKFGANSGDTYTAKLGSTVNVKGADSNTDFSKFDGGKNIMTQVDTKGNITVALANDVEVASAKFGDTVKIDNNGINAGNTVIDGVKAGSIAAGSQQAVNGGQVRDVAESVAKALGDGAKVNPDGTVTAPTYTITKTDGSTVTANSVGGALNYFNQEIVKPITFTGDSGSYDAKLGNTVNVKGDGKNISTSVSGNNLTISMTDTPEFSRVTTGGTVMNSNGLTTGGGNGPSLTTSGINAAGTKISNVANATEAGDAVNFGQVQAMGNNLSRRINEVDKSARAGIAGALATAGLYQAYLPGKSMVSVGAGTYRGENALAIGVSRISDNGKIGVKLTGMSTSQGDAGGSVSVGYQW